VLFRLHTHAGRTAEVRLSSEHRVRHCHIVGQPATARATFSSILIRQAIEAGEGVAVSTPTAI